jgi:hypothetical protein
MEPLRGEPAQCSDREGFDGRVCASDVRIFIAVRRRGDVPNHLIGADVGQLRLGDGTRPHNRAVTLDQDAKHDEQPPKRRAITKVLAWWKRLGYGQRVAIGIVAYVAVALPIVLYAPAGLLNNWVPGLSPEEQGKLLGAAGNLVLLALGGVIAVVTVGLSLSRHRQELDAAERDRQRLSDDQNRERARLAEVNDQRRIETERALRQRFVTTAQLLSDPAPVNRQAALYALGALADDWDAIGKPDEVQVCIEVLTGYLRAPRSDAMLLPLDMEEAQYLEREDYYDAQHTTPLEVSVKQAGYTVIRNHLRQGTSPSWSDRHLNLSRAHIDFSVELLQTVIREGGALDLRGTRIVHSGTVDLADARISDGGRLLLAGAKITGRGSVDLSNTVITGRGSIDLRDAWIANGHVYLRRAQIRELGGVILRDATVRQRGSVDLQGALVGGNIDLTSVSISGKNARIILASTAIIDGGNIDLADATVSDGGYVSLDSAEIGNGGRVDIAGATIGASGGIDLTRVVASPGAMFNPDAPTIRPGGRLIQPNGVPSKKGPAAG